MATRLRDLPIRALPMRVLSVAALILTLQPEPVAAQTVAVFGAQVCQAWLAEPAVGGLGGFWILGSWSGLNLGSLLRHDSADIGRTLTAQDVLASVRAMCQQQPSLPLSQATVRAWASAKARGQ